MDHTFYIELESGTELTIIADVDASYDGIGHYEYHGQKCYDRGNMTVELNGWKAYDKEGAAVEVTAEIEALVEAAWDNQQVEACEAAQQDYEPDYDRD